MHTPQHTIQHNNRQNLSDEVSGTLSPIGDGTSLASSQPLWLYSEDLTLLLEATPKLLTLLTGQLVYSPFEYAPVVQRLTIQHHVNRSDKVRYPTHTNKLRRPLRRLDH